VGAVFECDWDRGRDDLGAEWHRPVSWVDRPALLQRLDQALTRRVTTVTAAAGFGKTTILAAWSGTLPCRTYMIDAEHGELSEALLRLGDALPAQVVEPDHQAAARPVAGDVGTTGPRADQDHVVLILDNLHEAPADSVRLRLIDNLCRRPPPALHLVLSSRSEPPIPVERLRGRGQLLELDAHTLAFTHTETLELLTTALQDPTPAADLTRMAQRLHTLTGGWPTAVVLAGEWLRDQPPASRLPLIERLGRPGNPLFGYLATEIFAHEPPQTRELLRRMAALPHFTADLCHAVGLHTDEEQLYRLARRTMLIGDHAEHPGWFTVCPLARNFLDTIAPLDPNELHTLRQQAAAWHNTNPHPRTSPLPLSPSADHLKDPAGTPAGTPVQHWTPPPAAPPVATLRREGDYWTLDHGGTIARLRHTKGLRYLAELLTRPDTELHALQLSGTTDGFPPHPHHTLDPELPASSPNLGPLLDNTAKAAYRQRLDDLRDDLAEAEAFHDPERARKAHHEIDALTHELARAIGLGGRDRPTGSPAERARINITRTLRAAITHITHTHPGLGHHLNTTIHTGTFCSYQPGPCPTITWHL
jgi:hypothetical protein